MSFLDNVPPRNVAAHIGRRVGGWRPAQGRWGKWGRAHAGRTKPRYGPPSPVLKLRTGLASRSTFGGTDSASSRNFAVPLHQAHHGRVQRGIPD